MPIKSFQGARRQQSKADTTSLKVSDYMTTNLITFTPHQSIESVMQALIKHRISGAPVVNDKNELIGIISETDCIKHISESKYYNMPSDSGNNVAKKMNTNIDTIDKDMNIFDAATKFINSKRRRFPVVENGKLIGQISQKDVLKAALSLQGNTWKK